MTAPSHARPGTPTMPDPATPFGRIACGVNGTRGSNVAVELALELAGPGSVIDFVAVCDARGAGASRMASTGAARAGSALDAARRAAAKHERAATIELRHHPQPRRALLDAAASHDLLIVGARPGSRAGGIVLGSTATLALHECPVPLLIARPVPGGRRLADRILVATTGTGAERHVTGVAARLAAAAGGTVTLLHIEGPAGPAVRHELAAEAAEVLAVTGTDPVVAVVRGHGAEPILEAATDLDATLLVLGSRCLTGVRALASVSERVGAAARCPVLVLREP